MTMRTNYRKMPRAVHRDNKEYYNRGRKWNDTIGIVARIPSLKRDVRTWKNFYNLYPYLKDFLESGGKRGMYIGQKVIRITLKDNIYTVVDERIHGVDRDRIKIVHYWSDWTPSYEYVQTPRRRTMKFLKTW